MEGVLTSFRKRYFVFDSMINKLWKAIITINELWKTIAKLQNLDWISIQLLSFIFYKKQERKVIVINLSIFSYFKWVQIWRESDLLCLGRSEMDDSNKKIWWMNVIYDHDTNKLFTQIYSVFFFAFFLHALIFFLTFGSVCTNSTKNVQSWPFSKSNYHFLFTFLLSFPPLSILISVILCESWSG